MVTVYVVESQFVMLHAIQKDFRLPGFGRRLPPPSHGRIKSICLVSPTEPSQDSSLFPSLLKIIRYFYISLLNLLHWYFSKIQYHIHLLKMPSPIVTHFPNFDFTGTQDLMNCWDSKQNSDDGKIEVWNSKGIRWQISKGFTAFISVNILICASINWEQWH